MLRQVRLLKSLADRWDRVDQVLRPYRLALPQMASRKRAGWTEWTFACSLAECGVSRRSFVRNDELLPLKYYRGSNAVRQ